LLLLLLSLQMLRLLLLLLLLGRILRRVALVPPVHPGPRRDRHRGLLNRAGPRLSCCGRCCIG